MKITAISLQVKNPHRVSLMVDGKYAFSLSLDGLAKYRLKKDDELSEADVKKFKQISADGKLRARALEWTMNRPHSTRELKDYLYKKKADPKLSEKLIDEFSGKGYINDQRFTEWYVDLLTRRGKSNRAIKSELFKKGIGREVADNVIGENDNEQQRLKDIISKKSRLSRYKSDPQKLMQYLVAQGFNWQDVKEALKINAGED
jgi:regulatory protein